MHVKCKVVSQGHVQGKRHVGGHDGVAARGRACSSSRRRSRSLAVTAGPRRASSAAAASAGAGAKPALQARHCAGRSPLVAGNAACAAYHGSAVDCNRGLVSRPFCCQRRLSLKTLQRTNRNKPRLPSKDTFSSGRECPQKCAVAPQWPRGGRRCPDPLKGQIWHILSLHAMRLPSTKRSSPLFTVPTHGEMEGTEALLCGVLYKHVSFGLRVRMSRM